MPRSFWDWTFEGRSAKWLYVVGLLLLVAYSHYGSYLIAPFLLFLADTSDWPPFLADLYLRLTLLILLITVPLWVHFVH